MPDANAPDGRLIRILAFCGLVALPFVAFNDADAARRSVAGNYIAPPKAWPGKSPSVPAAKGSPTATKKPSAQQVKSALNKRSSGLKTRLGAYKKNVAKLAKGKARPRRHRKVRAPKGKAASKHAIARHRALLEAKQGRALTDQQVRKALVQQSAKVDKLNGALAQKRGTLAKLYAAGKYEKAARLQAQLAAKHLGRVYEQSQPINAKRERDLDNALLRAELATGGK